MAQQHHDSTAGDALTEYLQSQATEFLRSLRLHGESGVAAAEASEAARALRRAARRISGTLHTFRPLTDQGWADGLRTELAWLSGTLALEHAYASRQDRLLEALHRLSGAQHLPPARTEVPDAWAVLPAPTARGGDRPAPGPGGPGTPPGSSADEPGTTRRPSPGGKPGALTVGAARAGALLERQLTLARTRAHSAALQALGSSRFHAVADAVAVLASEVPLAPAEATHPYDALPPLAARVEARLAEAVATLPLGRAAHPYNAEALVHGLASAPASEQQDAPWHQVRLLLRLHRYAQEVLGTDAARLAGASEALDRHRDAAEAAAASAAAARTPRIAPATAYALGVLHADQRHEVEAARFAFQQLWQRSTVAAT
ncbi:CHAD domain-containing protein [Streptomyces sp. A3M-1-3]|uniref:CHAD domain-containing protein n=1 Tax=Streptomyces sp. A3M-1-3 TaxID=2962044 RepID=UPI0020B82FD3|nr:CHAD domain-containing protein [Streptomyces sp. A3M-1-3]MCP3821044.1 CHAD domain-containing protein [Streptomyces sp. A3M-1-3]